MADSEVFEYTYSAPEKSEVARIREKYLPKEETKLDRLRALDALVSWGLLQPIQSIIML